LQELIHFKRPGLIPSEVVTPWPNRLSLDPLLKGCKTSREPGCRPSFQHMNTVGTPSNYIQSILLAIMPFSHPYTYSSIFSLGCWGWNFKSHCCFPWFLILSPGSKL
jgi:hypothetical protein